MTDQEAIILAFFKKRKGGYTPHQVHAFVLRREPIITIRKIIASMTEAGTLIQEKETGKPTTWRLRSEPMQPNLF